MNPLGRNALDWRPENDSSILGFRVRLEPSIVEGLGDEGTDGRVKSARSAQEDAAVGADSRLRSQQEIQHRQPGLPRMDALNRLSQLHLIPDQNEVPCRGAHRDDVGRGDLSRLVNEQVVQVLVEPLIRKEPRGAGQERCRQADVIDALGTSNQLSVVDRFGVVGRRLLDPAKADFGTLCGILDCVEKIVDRLMGIRGDAYLLSAANQFDDDLGARVGLAGTRRPLNEQVRLLHSS